MAKKYADKGLVVVAPSLDAEAAVKQFRTKHNVKYPMLTSAGQTAKAYGVEAYPTMVLVGKDDKIKWIGHFESPDFIMALEAELAR